MSLGGSINDFYRKYKKPLFIIVLFFFVYKLFSYNGNVYEGYGDTCDKPTTCSSCIAKKYNSGSPMKCVWSNEKTKNGKIRGCAGEGALRTDKGYSGSCS